MNAVLDYIQANIPTVFPKYTYPQEKSINPAYVDLEHVDRKLRLHEKRIFAFRKDNIIALGVKNSNQEDGYHGLDDSFDEDTLTHIPRDDRYGHPSLAVPHSDYDGSVYLAGFICQREHCLQVFLSSGRYNRHDRLNEGIAPLSRKHQQVLESYLCQRLQKAFGKQRVVFYDTTPGAEDDRDSSLFFSDQPFANDKPSREYTPVKAAFILSQFSRKPSKNLSTKFFIEKHIKPVLPKYSRLGEGNINPLIENIKDVVCPLKINETRIWLLQSTFKLFVGVKNTSDYYGYQGFKEIFSDAQYKELVNNQLIDANDRYAHPSLAVPELGYDGSAFYAGYIKQRQGYLQIYLGSGRYHRDDIDGDALYALEDFIAKRFQEAYGDQPVIFEPTTYDNFDNHAAFFSGQPLRDARPARAYPPQAAKAAQPVFQVESMLV